MLSCIVDAIMLNFRLIPANSGSLKMGRRVSSRPDSISDKALVILQVPPFLCHWYQSDFVHEYKKQSAGDVYWLVAKA
jgi:hypothetical protein